MPVASFFCSCIKTQGITKIFKNSSVHVAIPGNLRYNEIGKYNKIMGDKMKYIAHIAEDGREQSVEAHLLGTAGLAKQFAESFGAGPDAELAGSLHDAGKCTAGFQARLHGGARIDHSTAGTKAAFEKGNLPVSFVIAGHHGGIPDGGNAHDAQEEATLCGRVKRNCTFDASILGKLALPPVSPPSWLGRDLVQNAFYTRMLYSCLVDADFQDTQNFMDGTPAPRGAHASVQKLLELVRERAGRYLAADAQDPVSMQRNSVLRTCMEHGKAWPNGLYTLTVPTGGGKTFSSLAFALEQAAAQNMDRVIYVIPYTSIIDQTASVFSELLGEENVLAHYAGAEYQTAEPEEMTREQHRKLLASENWDAPVIVTTAVQFFESLYTNRSSRCRKLHNISNSVVIFDEAQTIPNDYLMPCLSAMTQLVQFYHTTAVLCTATQPALSPLLKKLAPAIAVQEICPHTEAMYAALRRTTLADLGCVGQEALCVRLCQHTQMLCVVNRRSTAQKLYDALPQEGRYCLTTLLCAADRKAQIAQIRARLKNGLPCRVVSTSLIEAGVDVDFPAAYREDSGLDSLLQTAGRCNREGKRDAAHSFVYRFCLHGQTPPAMLAKNVSALHDTARKYADVSSPDAIHAYFAELFQLKGDNALDKKQILASTERGIDGCLLPFAQIAERFRLIEAPTRTVYLPIEEGTALCRRLQAGEVSRTLLRKLGPYSVDCYEQQFQALDRAGALELLTDGAAILIDLSKYDRKTGLTLNIETGIGIYI